MQTLIMEDPSGGMEIKLTLNDDNLVTECMICYQEPKPLLELINIHALTSPKKIHYGEVPPLAPKNLSSR